MTKAYLICKINEGGGADIDMEATPYTTYVLAAQIGNSWGCYMFVATAAQLTAINALPNVYGICTVANLDNVIAVAVRNKVNTWLDARGFPTIPAGWTYRKVVNAIFKRINEKFDIDKLDILDG